MIIKIRDLNENRLKDCDKLSSVIIVNIKIKI